MWSWERATGRTCTRVVGAGCLSGGRPQKAIPTKKEGARPGRKQEGGLKPRLQRKRRAKKHNAPGSAVRVFVGGLVGWLFRLVGPLPRSLGRWDAGRRRSILF